MTSWQQILQENKAWCHNCKNVWKKIQDSICNGQKHTTFMFESVYPEVAEALATLGYDVEIEEGCNALDSSTTVNWSKAEPDKKGTVTYK